MKQLGAWAKMRLAGIGVLAVFFSDFVHAWSRGYTEDFGFEWASVAVSSRGIAVVFAFALWGALSLFRAAGASVHAGAVAAGIGGLCLAGGALGEARVRWDEQRFVRDVEAQLEQRDPSEPSRRCAQVRCWPCSDCTLFFTQEQGFWATE